LLLVLVLVILPTYVYAERSIQPPSKQNAVIGNLQLQSTTVEITGLNLGGPSLNLKAVIYNPYVFGASLEAANYSVYANGHYVGDGQLAHGYDVTSRSSQVLAFPVNLGWMSAFQTTGSYILGGGNLNWRVNGTAHIELGGLTFFVQFEFATG
jgi:LEA14-like dessication related protein